MKKLSRYFGLVMILLVLAIYFGFNAQIINAGSAPIKIKVNGKDFNQNEDTVIIDGRTFIPVRKFTELLGSQVSWDSKTREVMVIKGNTMIKFLIDSKMVYYNSEKLYMDAKAQIIDGRTYAPVRFVAEAFRHKVGWDKETRTVLIDEVPGYVVKEGDTLQLISETFGVSIDDLKKWNQLSSDVISVDTKIFFEPISFNSVDKLRTKAVVEYSDDELEWLAKIIYAEARDEPYEGLVAVGAVVINRVKNPWFPNTIYDVIFQQSQFTPAKTGLIYNIKPDEASYRAAEEALLGVDPVDGALFFNNPKISTSSFFKNKKPLIKIGNHNFYR
ncbi:hypothetical protein BHF71_10505 [Vulcanibacillus modesticaldus]|uniref:Uncharacterized protein n=1 Tax=Vulcanibacillus modesticaldus TaxID=337097 RepID=A0A1D2YTF0_9BACI|nr:stalk domain-containing protein [Vulcanibacillus modesticaldus]OEF98968.1 hypothetical protein BHF71_10505 [Vulcanibacillus modesticaldus]